MDNALVVRSDSSLMVASADPDTQLVKLWLHGRSEHTQRAYGTDAARFLTWVNKPLHLVSLTVYDRSPDVAAEYWGRGRLMPLSGFLVSVRGIWCLVTAGHILDGLERAIAAGRRLEEFQLDDTLGWEAKHHEPIPFDFAAAPKYYFNDDDGLDVGVIGLSPYYRSHLEANNVVAMGEESWEKVWPETFDRYALLGFPTALQAPDPNVKGRVMKTTAFLWVDKVDAPPPEMIKPAARIYGRVMLPDGRDGVTLDDIDGMSGGPLLGFKFDGRVRYWLVGVQSAWQRSSRTIAALPLQEFVRHLGEFFDDLFGRHPHDPEK